MGLSKIVYLLYFNLSIQFVNILPIGADTFGTLVQVSRNCMPSNQKLWKTRKVFEAVKD